MLSENCFVPEERGKKHLRRPKDILVIRNGALGDFILTLPVLKSLNNAFPFARIVVMGNPAIVALVQHQIAGIISNDMPGLYTLYGDRCTIPEDIKQKLGCFDLVICYGKDPDGNVMSNLKRIGIPWIIDGTFSIAERLTTHATDLLLLPLKKEGLPVYPDPPRIIPSVADREFAGQFLGSIQKSARSQTLVAFHPGSGSSKKCWPVKNFSQLATWVKNVFGVTILLISGPADQYRTDEMMSLIKHCNPVLVHQSSLTHLAAILERCSMFIGNDSGVTHLAAAVGIPTLTLFGPTDFRIWGPKHEQVKHLQSSYPCAPCSPKQMDQCSHPACMEALSLGAVEKVFTGTFSQLLLSFFNNPTTYHFGRES